MSLTNTVASLFKFKDSLPMVMRANLIYLYKCPCCEQGSYVGSTQRRLQARIAAHKGVSYRTGQQLSTKEHSAPRTHSNSHKKTLLNTHFKILTTAQNKSQLLLLESLYIKEFQPPLNINTSSIPLLIA